MWDGYFKGKKITVMGIGLLGGSGDIRFLAEQGADIIVTDLKPEKDLGPALDALKEFTNIRYTLGKHDLADFKDRDLIIQAPGTPFDSPSIAEARKNGIPITMWSALFSRFARKIGVTIVGITGTRGKTTTTLMIEAMVRATGKEPICGGNIQGTAMLPRLPELTPDSLVIMELDSWKLQGFREEGLSPDIAIFTTFYPDHLNYYRGDMEMYLADKAEIFLNQKAGDTLILGEQCADIVRKIYKDRIVSDIIIAREADLPAGLMLSTPGAHNRLNAACAFAAGSALGIDELVIAQALKRFAGVPGRLEKIRRIRGVDIYNDTTATTPDATLAGLKALGMNKKLILIMGGTDKELDMTILLDALPKHCKELLLLSGTGTEKIKERIGMPFVECGNLLSAVRHAYDKACEGDVILFSPAFASFGMFKNEYDRGDRFKETVAVLT